MASDVLRYRAIPIGEFPDPVTTAGAGLIGRCPRWPAPGSAGSGARFRFINPKRVAGTAGMPLSDGATARSAVVAVFEAATNTWRTHKLPLPVHAIESIAMDANASGVVVGGCVLRREGVPDRVVGCVWHVPTDVGGTPSPLVHLGGGTNCDGIFGTSVPATHAEAIGVDPATLATQVFGASGSSLLGHSALCLGRSAWVGNRWNLSDGEMARVRRPSTCVDDSLSFPPAVVLPDGSVAIVRAVHISSVGALEPVVPPDSDRAAPIAGGALGMESSDWGPCQSHECFSMHAAVFLSPFAEEPHVLTFDIHQSIVVPPDQGAPTDSSSWVARVDATLALDTDWMAVGVRSQEKVPDDSSGEGVVWAGKAVGSVFGWCGRSMVDDRVVQRRAFWSSQQTTSVGTVSTRSVHDLLSSGVAVGVGSVAAPPYGSDSQLILLTEGCDINGDQWVDRRDLQVLLLNWNQTENPCDLTGDGLVNADDLGILMQGIGPIQDGRPAIIGDICEDHWAKTPPLPYVAAAQALGFQDFSEFGDFAASMEKDEAVLLACSVTIVAQAIAGQ